MARASTGSGRPPEPEDAAPLLGLFLGSVAWLSSLGVVYGLAVAHGLRGMELLASVAAGALAGAALGAFWYFVVSEGLRGRGALKPLRRFRGLARSLTASTFAALVESLLFALTPLSALGWWTVVLFLLTLLSPLAAYSLKLAFEEPGRGLVDRSVLEAAWKYGGVLTQGALAWELSASLEDARRALERFVKHGEAMRRRVGRLVIYDFPGARAHLGREEGAVVEALVSCPRGASREELARAAGLAPEAADEALRRLEARGVVRRLEGGLYVLRGVAPYARPGGGALGQGGCVAAT